MIYVYIYVPHMPVYVPYVHNPGVHGRLCGLKGNGRHRKQAIKLSG